MQQEPMPKLTRQEKLDAQAVFAAGDACEDCGGIHKRACPRVRRQVWLRTGAGAGERTEVEYWRTWDGRGVIWPEEAYDPEGTGE
jgi:hypothetical protein